MPHNTAQTDPRGEALVPEAVGWRGMSMDRSKVVVQQFHIAPGDLGRRRAMAEDPLEAEDVATVHQE